MKREIIHDAINHQEDEDSSTYRNYSRSDEIPAKKKRAYRKDSVTYLFRKAAKNKIAPGRTNNR